jgi:hypothetical protein
MGTIKTDYITGITGTENSGPITLSGDTATLGTGVTLDSGITGIPAAGVTGTLGSSVTLPATHIQIGDVQSGMTTRTGSLKWGDSQIGSVTGSAFTIDNTGSYTKIDMAQNALIWINWMGVGSGTGYWSINKNSGTAGNTTSSQRIAWSYQTHGQVGWHGYALSTDYFVCVLQSDTLQNTTDRCICSIIALKVA